MKRIFSLLFLVAAALPLAAQTAEWGAVERGNAAYRAARYADAERAYIEALQAQPDNAAAHYNLGLAYLAQDNTDAALRAFEDAARLAPDDDLAARAYHNIGVIRQGQALVDDAAHTDLLRRAADAYKQSLRRNPADDETRYNLALCQHQLRQDDNQDQQQQQQQQQQDDQQDNSNPPPSSTQQLLNLAQRAEDDTRQRINAARQQPRASAKNW